MKTRRGESLISSGGHGPSTNGQKTTGTASWTSHNVLPNASLKDMGIVKTMRSWRPLGPLLIDGPVSVSPSAGSFRTHGQHTLSPSMKNACTRQAVLRGRPSKSGLSGRTIRLRSHGISTEVVAVQQIGFNSSFSPVILGQSSRRFSRPIYFQANGLYHRCCDVSLLVGAPDAPLDQVMASG